MGQAQECDSVKLDNGIPVVHFLIIQSPMVMQIYEQIIKHHPKRPHTIINMNYNTNTDNTIAMNADPIIQFNTVTFLCLPHFHQHMLF
jgi:hypothetical protein